VSADYSIKCPKCGVDNVIDMLQADDGSKIVCRNCKARIILNFEGKTLKETANEINDEFKRMFKGR